MGEELTSIEDMGKVVIKAAPEYKTKNGEMKPYWQNYLTYDSTSETLEPVYFWIIDLLSSMQYKEKDVEKLVDNFVASPGSGQFAELGSRMTRMQEEGMKILGVVNQVIKSIINIIYDLREFEIRLRHYESLKSDKKEVREAGMLSLKQIWMDNVDIKRGAGSINAMASFGQGQLGFTTLRDAFMAVDSLEKVDELDLNERVKRVLKPRVAEFFQWIQISEEELRKRFQIETSYLKTQRDSLRLYARWAKPYLTAAEKLMMTERKTASLVTTFNTTILELLILAKTKTNIKDEARANEGAFPQDFAKKYERKQIRDFYSCIMMDFTFRGIPQRIQQQPGYVFGGRADIKFWGFALNQDEYDLFEAELADSELNDTLSLVKNVTDESLGQIEEDLDHFINKSEEEKKKAEEEKKLAETSNPFTALLSFAIPKSLIMTEEDREKKKKEEKEKRMLALKQERARPDTYEEKIVRKLAEENAAAAAFKVYDSFKKAHDMASHADPFLELHFKATVLKPD